MASTCEEQKNALISMRNLAERVRTHAYRLPLVEGAGELALKELREDSMVLVSKANQLSAEWSGDRKQLDDTQIQERLNELMYQVRGELLGLHNRTERWCFSRLFNRLLALLSEKYTVDVQGIAASEAETGSLGWYLKPLKEDG